MIKNIEPLLKKQLKKNLDFEELQIAEVLSDGQKSKIRSL